MLYDTVSYDSIFYHMICYCIVWYHTIMNSTIKYRNTLNYIFYHNILQCCIVWYIIWHNIVWYRTMQYRILMFCIDKHSIIQYRINFTYDMIIIQFCFNWFTVLCQTTLQYPISKIINYDFLYNMIYSIVKYRIVWCMVL